LAVGLQAVEKLRDLVHEEAMLRKSRSLRKHVDALLSYGPLKKRIIDFWLHEDNRNNDLWAKHRDINMVMLATSLCPAGYLGK
jgi:hypothetical protein